MILTVHNLAFQQFPVSLALMGLTTIITFAAFIKESWFRGLMLHPYSIVVNKQYYRLLSHDLIHVDRIHWLFNEFMFLNFGIGLERYLNHINPYGSILFGVVYLGSNLAGSIASTYRHRTDFLFSGAGFSGSIMGCMFCYIILQPEVIAFYAPVLGAVKNIYGGLIYVVIMIIYQRRRRDERINIELHFFGALAGGCCAIALMFLVK
ncbi:rhomboid family intramembrane serine protease [Mucilaginibacter sp. PAMB04274]|uniref:rhomboid family intramembrane serine protease n=1 Tax=Mucilaginibacter sp. PAMB04274 TaxID=3138568 RepID=UPI0031F63B9A